METKEIKYYVDDAVYETANVVIQRSDGNHRQPQLDLIQQHYQPELEQIEARYREAIRRIEELHPAAAWPYMTTRAGDTAMIAAMLYGLPINEARTAFGLSPIGTPRPIMTRTRL